MMARTAHFFLFPPPAPPPPEDKIGRPANTHTTYLARLVITDPDLTCPCFSTYLLTLTLLGSRNPCPPRPFPLRRSRHSTYIACLQLVKFAPVPLTFSRTRTPVLLTHIPYSTSSTSDLRSCPVHACGKHRHPPATGHHGVIRRHYCSPCMPSRDSLSSFQP